MRNLQEQVKKAFCYQKLFWPFTVWINCSSDLKNFANSWPSASNFKSFSRSLEHFFSQYARTILVTKYHFPTPPPLHFSVKLSHMIHLTTSNFKAHNDHLWNPSGWPCSRSAHIFKKSRDFLLFFTPYPPAVTSPFQKRS